ncbi:hypothetical protein [Streptomyces longwoodensis]|uniref:hypothetical protein n=1 Tax=Streptomyces longwoodensis TaxID=68231 RepID=UPI0036FFDE24
MSTQEPTLTAAQLAQEVAALVHRYERGREQAQARDESLVARMSRAARAREEWKVIEPQLPGLLFEAHEQGWQPKQLTRMFDLTESYVYRALREQRAANAQ